MAVVINGTAGNDTLVVTVTGAGTFDYVLNGGASVSPVDTDVTFNGFGGSDSITITYQAGTGQFITLGTTTITGSVAPDFTLNDVELTSLVGQELADQFTVNAVTTAATSIDAGAGGDQIIFQAGASLNGGAVNGGAGNDKIDYFNYTTPVAVNLGLGTTGLSGTLQSDQESPPTTHAGSGTVNVSNYNAATHTFDISVAVSGLAPADVTGFHIHRASPGLNGPIIIDFGAGPLVPDGVGGFTFNATGVALPVEHEAAFLGGATYFNIHTAAFGSGAIRGQLFSGGNVNLANGTATGTGGISGIEDAFGGTGVSAQGFGDSLIGSFAANQLFGGGGNDTILGGPGADLMDGQGDNDVLIWSNGDGSDVVDGGAGSGDLVQVNGSTSAGDVFTVGANGARIDFDRISPGPFGLDIGTAETLTVNGIGGDDSLTISTLAGIADLALVNFNGFAGSDTLVGDNLARTWNLTGANRGSATGGLAFTGTENLTGNASADVFAFTNGASVGGVIDGGAGSDTLDYSAFTTALAVNLGLGSTGLAGSLFADEEVPDTGAAATGTVAITDFNVTAHTFDIAVAVSGIDPATVSGFHIHRGGFGSNGPIIIDFGTAGLVSDGLGGFTFVANDIAYDPLHEAALLGGLTYLNVHTPTFPSGAIRGQLFSLANVNLATGVATGVGGLVAIENAIGGSGVSAQGFGDGLIGSFSANTLRGGPGNDVLVGAPGGDLLQGEANDDTMVWSNGDGSDVMDGGIGSDTVQVNGSVAGSDAFLLQPGVGGHARFDRTNLGLFNLDIATSETLTVNGVGGDDSFQLLNLAGVADLASVKFNGLAGADTLNGGATAIALTITGGNEADQLSGGSGNDVILGQDGNDVVFGGAGNDNVSGDTGDDTIVGDDGNDVLGGDDGNDRINSGAGTDTIFGGAGNDELGGGAGDDIIVGQDGNDVIFGEEGVDVANAGAGADIMLGGLGNDTFGGGADNDVLVGGDGDDLLFGESGTDNMNGESGADGVVGGAGDDLLGGGVDNDIVVGDDGNDALWGELGNDAMNGGFGNDTLLGSDGDDVIGGGAGDDDLNGGFGNDTLFGENGNDILNGSAGNDIYVGGGNDDTFVFALGDGNDTVADFFAGGPEDRIWFVGTSLHSFADVQSHATTVSGNTVITYNSFFTVTLNGVTAGQLTAGDFIFT